MKYGSLQDVADLNMLKELETLSFIQCSNLKSVSLKQSSLQEIRTRQILSQLILSSQTEFCASNINMNYALYFYQSFGSCYIDERDVHKDSRLLVCLTAEMNTIIDK